MVHISCMQGIGIAENDREQIFARFHQGSNSMNETKGTGLGLAISKKLAQAMGGDITLDSEIGKGSTFTLTLPYEPAIRTTIQAAAR